MARRFIDKYSDNQIMEDMKAADQKAHNIFCCKTNCELPVYLQVLRSNEDCTGHKVHKVDFSASITLEFVKASIQDNLRRVTLFAMIKEQRAASTHAVYCASSYPRPVLDKASKVPDLYCLASQNLSGNAECNVFSRLIDRLCLVRDISSLRFAVLLRRGPCKSRNQVEFLQLLLCVARLL